MDHEIILFISDKAVDIERINTQKNQYERTGFFYIDISKIDRLSGEQKYVNMVAAHKNLTLN
jgi:hypothetical protein